MRIYHQLKTLFYLTKIESENYRIKKMQNLIILMEPAIKVGNVSFKAGNMFLNRFCIDEDAAYELLCVNNLEKSSMGELRKSDGVKGTESSSK